MRLQRFLAACGLGSRRACEDLIRGGAVTVDGRLVTEMGVVIDPALHEVCVHGRRVYPQAHVYLAINKPAGVMCTSRDPHGRRIVHDLLPGGFGRLFTIGRLDNDSEGLLLLTNDGDFAHRLMHPRHHVEKEYLVWPQRSLRPAECAQVLAGVETQGETLRALRIEAVGAADRRPCYRVVLGEGRKRHIRRMFAELGARVGRLQRVRIGPLLLGGLEQGRYRQLTPAEVTALRAASR